MYRPKIQICTQYLGKKCLKTFWTRSPPPTPILNILLVVTIRGRSKRSRSRIWLKLTLSSLFNTLIKNPNLFQRCQFEILNRKILDFKNIAGIILQSFTNYCNKNVAPFSGHAQISTVVLNSCLIIDHPTLFGLGK